MNIQTTMPRLADDLYDEASDTLISCARKAGIRIVDASIRVCVSRDVRLASAVAEDFAQAAAATPQVDPVMGVFFIQGRVGGQLKRPGFYAVRVVQDGTERIAVVSDSKGKSVAKVPIKTTCGTEAIAMASGCCSQPDVGEGVICLGFTCCNPLTGCISNELCLTT
ncbi:MAG: hypothetical protein AB8B47_01990 [Roseobacter sp.]